jgi:hypothetical protein
MKSLVFTGQVFFLQKQKQSKKNTSDFFFNFLFRIIVLLSVKQMDKLPRWCKGSHARLKILWTDVREGSNPSLGTMF